MDDGLNLFLKQYCHGSYNESVVPLKFELPPAAVCYQKQQIIIPNPASWVLRYLARSVTDTSAKFISCILLLPGWISRLA
jgi:hypothetical protein